MLLKTFNWSVKSSGYLFLLHVLSVWQCLYKLRFFFQIKARIIASYSKRYMKLELVIISAYFSNSHNIENLLSNQKIDNYPFALFYVG